MAKPWKKIVFGVVLLLFVISMVVVLTNNHMALDLIKDCIVIGRLTPEQLSLPVTSMYLVSAKLFPIINSCYSMHWSVIVETPNGFFNITTSRYLAIYIYQVGTPHDKFTFKSGRWEDTLYILKHYQLRDEFKQKPPTVYETALVAMEYYNKNDRMKYSPVNHNCQHVAQYIINSFCMFDENDPFLRTVKGNAMIKKLINDTFTGPKIMI